MKREDDVPLWDALGHAARPEVSPFFARNVVRQVREQSARPGRLRSWLSVRRLVPASGLAVAVIAAVLFVHGPVLRPKPVGEQDLVAKIDAQDYEVVADLDELLASDENSLWDDNSSL
jgi:hypothetical protein